MTQTISEIVDELIDAASTAVYTGTRTIFHEGEGIHDDAVTLAQVVETTLLEYIAEFHPDIVLPARTNATDAPDRKAQT